MRDSRTPVALAIAGSDSGGGAGIQADLKAFARCGVHGATAIVALTAQNTVGVSDVMQVPPAMIAAQVESVVSDISVDAIKIGMLGSAETAQAVAGSLEKVEGVPVVVDPVMISESGSRLLDPEALQVLVERIIPGAAVITPNLPEAARLLGREGEVSEADQEEMARALLDLGPEAVIVTGGHTTVGDDLLFDGSELTRVSGVRHPDGAAHGSGCTHASSLAAGLAIGLEVDRAARLARTVATEAVGQGLASLGAGAGPVSAHDLVEAREWARSAAGVGDPTSA
jgi:hydroxymethylpyrimidine/phosphomethylpyrimidine kinase